MRKYLLVLPLLIVLAAGVFLLTTAKATKVVAANSCNSDELSGQFDYDARTAIFEGKELDAPLFARGNEETFVLGTTDGAAERWIEVDLSEQKLKAWDGNTLFLETPISTGLPQTPTPTGEFRIWIKLRYTRMQGGSGRGYYNLPNVPFTMFLENTDVPRWKGYGLHGTYWHNHFGTQRSHGCVNLPTPMAEKIYYWVGPVLADGKNTTYSSSENLGTRVVIHE